MLNLKKARPPWLWTVVLAGYISLIYVLCSFGLDIFAMRGNTTCESLSSIINRAPTALIEWMAYPGTGYIDTPLSTDEFFVLECGYTLWFWIFFTVIVLIKATIRKLNTASN
jgi:hypothetical protein